MVEVNDYLASMSQCDIDAFEDGYERDVCQKKFEYFARDLDYAAKQLKRAVKHAFHYGQKHFDDKDLPVLAEDAKELYESDELASDHNAQRMLKRFRLACLRTANKKGALVESFDDLAQEIVVLRPMTFDPDF